MGLSSSTKTSSVKPVYAKEIEGAAGTLKGVYDANAGRVQSISDDLYGLLPDMLDKYREGDSGINAARGFITSTLNSGPTQNPFLDRMIADTGESVAAKTNASLGTRGLAGGSVAADLISRNLSRAENDLRYTDWNNAQGRKMQAAGMAPSIAAGDVIGVAPLLQVGDQAANLPTDVAGKYALGTGGLLGQYTNQKEKSSGSLLDSIGKAVSIGATLFSDVRLKEDIRRIGQTDAGLPLYSYRYKGGDAFYIGPMAHEVAAMQPQALGPVVSGFGTVHYGEVR